MKKYISLFAMALLFGTAFVSCDVETNEPAGGTKVEKMAGHWVVTVDAIVGDKVYEDPYDMGEWELYTYNTAADDADQMWISDNGKFWGFTIKTPVNYGERTFECKDVFIYTDDDDKDQFTTITEGKVLEGAGKNVNGMPTDSITLKMEYTDGPGVVYHIHGVRYAGF